jgi:hypothetical protein
MNIKLAALAALLLAPGQAMAEDVRIDCVTDQQIRCRDNETTCRPLKSGATYHFEIDLTKKTGSLVFCAHGSDCMNPSPITVVKDLCRGAIGFPDCLLPSLGEGIRVWEPIQEIAYQISNSFFVWTASDIYADHSDSYTGFGHCTVRP